MHTYRITKYNPKLRSSKGHYEIDEWTSISDIGTDYAAGKFGIAEYKNTEDKYVESVRVILSRAKIESLVINDFQLIGESKKNPELAIDPETADLVSKICDGNWVSGSELDWVIRLNLREIIWCRLKSADKSFVHFGYDYYMYMGIDLSEFDPPKLPSGIFLENFESPYLPEETL